MLKLNSYDCGFFINSIKHITIFFPLCNHHKCNMHSNFIFYEGNKTLKCLFIKLIAYKFKDKNEYLYFTGIKSHKITKI